MNQQTVKSDPRIEWDDWWRGLCFLKVEIRTNLYAWCGNNPVSRIDPSGMSSIFDGITRVIQTLCGYAGIPSSKESAHAAVRRVTASPKYQAMRALQSTAENLRNMKIGPILKAKKRYETGSLLGFEIMALEWITGMGAEEHYFGPGSPQVAAMQNSLVARVAINHYCQTGDTTGEAKFGPSGFIDAGLDPTQQFVGGVDWTIEPIGNQHITIDLKNKTSLSSFVPHGDDATWPEAWDPGRAGILGVNIQIPMSSTYQHYTWTQTLQCPAL